MRPSVTVAIFLSLETGEDERQAAAEINHEPGVIFHRVRAEQLAT